MSIHLDHESYEELQIKLSELASLYLDLYRFITDPDLTITHPDESYVRGMLEYDLYHNRRKAQEIRVDFSPEQKDSYSPLFPVHLDGYTKGLRRVLRELPKVLSDPQGEEDESLYVEYRDHLLWLKSSKNKVLNQSKKEGRWAEVSFLQEEFARLVGEHKEGLEKFMGQPYSF